MSGSSWDKSVLLVQLQSEGAKNVKKFCLAVSANSKLDVIHKAKNINDLRKGLPPQFVAIDDNVLFEAVAGEMNGQSQLVEKVEAFMHLTGTSVVRVSKFQNGSSVPSLVSFKVELRGGKLVAHTSNRAKAHGTAKQIEEKAHAAKQEALTPIDESENESEEGAQAKPSEPAQSASKTLKI